MLIKKQLINVWQIFFSLATNPDVNICDTTHTRHLLNSTYANYVEIKYKSVYIVHILLSL